MRLLGAAGVEQEASMAMRPGRPTWFVLPREEESRQSTHLADPRHEQGSPHVPRGKRVAGALRG
jgi:hypothetical protein